VAPTTFTSVVAFLGVAAVFVIICLYYCALVFQWSIGYLYVGLVGCSILFNAACLKAWNPTLIRQRAGMRRGTKKWDGIFVVFTSIASIAMIVVALNERIAARPSLPNKQWLTNALIVYFPGWFIVISSMAVNPFFEKTVRIQKERSHVVVDKGPYTVVRHPGYVGFSLWVISTPLLLNSRSMRLWGCVLLLVVALVVRTYFEDQTLQKELKGYKAYTKRVKFRLIPGLW
jgi:protein-S-isoprenylcysteine O-methyltransferase Ste14